MESGGGPCARGGKDEASLQRNADGRDFVSFVPQCMGKIRIHVFVTFTDGGAAFQEVPVEVIAGRPPVSLHVTGQGSFNGVISMDLTERSRKSSLWMSATYPGVKQPLTVAAKDARFRV